MSKEYRKHCLFATVTIVGRPPRGPDTVRILRHTGSGLSAVSRGSLVLDDMPEEEIRRLINMCEQEIEEELEGAHEINI